MKGLHGLESEDLTPGLPQNFLMATQGQTLPYFSLVVVARNKVHNVNFFVNGKHYTDIRSSVMDFQGLTEQKQRTSRDLYLRCTGPQSPKQNQYFL